MTPEYFHSFKNIKISSDGTLGEYLVVNRDELIGEDPDEYLRESILETVAYHMITRKLVFTDIDTSIEGLISIKVDSKYVLRTVKEFFELYDAGPTLEQIFRFPMDHKDSGAKNIGDFLRILLLTLWREGAGFSGKRPWGNSCWEYELYAPLIRYGAIKGKLDEEGYVSEVDTKEADALIELLIEKIFQRI